MKPPTILVAGATGNVGRHIATQLRDAGVNVRALSRDPSSPRLPAGVTAVDGDLTRPDSLRNAVAGAVRPSCSGPFKAQGAEPAVGAIAGQVRRIVYLSASSVQDGASPQDNGVWGQVEQAIRQSGAEWTFLRAGGFAANALAWADQIRSGGVVRWAYGQAARSLIHERDIAAVAVRALTDGKHAGATYVLTGPEAITQADQARTIGEVTGLPVRWEETSPEVIREQLTAITGDRAFAEHALAYWSHLIDQPEPVTPAVQDITGAPARTFRDWARDHASDFLPQSPQEVISRYVSLLRQQDLGGALKLLAPDVLRVAPLEPAGGSAGLRGTEAIMANSRRQVVGYEIRGVEIDGPYPHGDRFAVRFTFDEIRTSTGQPATTEKMSVYTVRDSTVTREDVSITRHRTHLRAATSPIASDDRARSARFTLAGVEFNDVIKRRRMVHAFTAEPLAPGTAERLLRAANRAPSAGFSQGYSFLVLEGEEQCAPLWQLLYEQTESEGTTQDDSPDQVDALSTAPLVIVPLASKAVYLDRYAQPDKGWTDRDDARMPIPYWYIDTGFTALLMLLAAVDEGLGAVFFGPPDIADFRARFGVPAQWTPIGVIAAGHPDPAADPVPPARASERKSLGELVHRGRW